VEQALTKEVHLHEAQCALLGCQVVEEGLKSYICTAYETIRRSGGPTSLIRHTDAEIEEFPLGTLMRLFEPLNTNAALAAKLQELRPKRNYCAHKAFMLVFAADVRPSIDLTLEFKKIEETRVLAWETFRMLEPELHSNEARLNAVCP
jgi:hypothetical protein